MLPNQITKDKIMEKVIRKHDECYQSVWKRVLRGVPFISSNPSDRVAVLVSAGYGAGWSTHYSNDPDGGLLFHPKLVQMVEEGRTEEITESWVEQELGLKGVYTAGTDGLYIEWVPVGTKFFIHEYDGHESIRTIDNINWITA
jgi:hypothetical protein